MTRRGKRWLAGALGAVGAAATIVVGCRIVTQPTRFEPTADVPADFPSDGFSHAAFESLLRRYVDASGGVDYDAWSADDDAVGELDGYLAAVARWSPENASARFADDSERLVYWVHAYNALVIRAVLANWPIESVTDVTAPVEFVKGLGFFYGQEFVVGERTYNLYDVERERILPSVNDARVHYVLNCASGGCPAIPPELPTGPALEPFLAEAEREFLADPQNVRVDDGDRLLVLSRIFEWYEDDFVNQVRRGGAPADRGIVDYLLSAAPAERRAEFERAAGYEVTYAEYDWAINERESAR